MLVSIGPPAVASGLKSFAAIELKILGLSPHDKTGNASAFGHTINDLPVLLVVGKKPGRGALELLNSVCRESGIRVVPEGSCGWNPDRETRPDNSRGSKPIH